MALELPKTLTLCSYAVNGSGVGHLSRLIAVNRWLRRYAAFCGVRTQHYFLTTSEADSMLFHEGFAGFKLPSKSVVEEAGIHKPTYLGLAKQWVWHSVGLLRPDLLLVDTFPNGSFQELLGVMDLVRHKALIMRPVKEDYSRRASFRSVAALYDRIIIPERGTDVVSALQLDPSRVHETGPIIATERFEALPRAEARRRLGLPDDAFCLLVSGGGGGDGSVDQLFDAMLRLTRGLPKVHLVLAAGPLFRGVHRHGPSVTFWTAPGLAPHFCGVDAAVCAAGFNTAHETMFLGVPTLFIPQQKVADDQDQRVNQLVEQGAALKASLHDEPALRAALTTLTDDTARQRMAERARAAVPSNHARDAAASLLELLLPRSVVRHAVETLDEEVFEFMRQHSVELPQLVEIATSLSGEEAAQDRAALELDSAMQLLTEAHACGVTPATVQRIALIFGRKLRNSRNTQEQVAGALGTLLSHPAAHGQSTALLSLVRSLSSEREWTVDTLATHLTTLLDHARQLGHDLFSLARVLADIQGNAESELSNAALLERARAQLMEVA